MLLSNVIAVAVQRAMAVTVNSTGARPATDACRVLGPGTSPTFHVSAAVVPSLLVGWNGPVTLPPPDITAKVTSLPATALPYWSTTRTKGGGYTYRPTNARAFSSSLVLSTVAAGPARPEAVKTTGGRAPTVAVSVLPPAVVPRRQLPTAATPLT